MTLKYSGKSRDVCCSIGAHGHSPGCHLLYEYQRITELNPGGDSSHDGSREILTPHDHVSKNVESDDSLEHFRRVRLNTATHQHLSPEQSGGFYRNHHSDYSLHSAWICHECQGQNSFRLQPSCISCAHARCDLCVSF